MLQLYKLPTSTIDVAKMWQSDEAEEGVRSMINSSIVDDSKDSPHG